MVTFCHKTAARQAANPQKRLARWSATKQGGFMPEDDREAVAEFIRTRGITRCPTVCVLPTQGLVPTADRVALEEHAVERDRLRRAQAAARWRPFLNLKATQ
jgi:hypothetical protein